MAIDVPSPWCLAQGRPTLHAAHICSHSLPCNTRLFAPVADHYHHGICRLDRYRVHRISLPRTDWHAMEQQEKKTKMLFNAKIYWKTHSTFYWLIYFVQQLLILGLTFCIVVRCFITKWPSNDNHQQTQKILKKYLILYGEGTYTLNWKSNLLVCSALKNMHTPFTACYDICAKVQLEICDWNKVLSARYFSIIKSINQFAPNSPYSRTDDGIALLYI